MKKLEEVRNRKQNNKGFSLVELIIVIAIMAVLVAILAPMFIKYVESSRRSADITAVEEIKKTMETSYSELSAKGYDVKDLEIVIDDKIEVTCADADAKGEVEKMLDLDQKLKSSNWGEGGIKLTFDDADGAVDGEVKVENVDTSVSDNDYKIDLAMAGKKGSSD